MKLVVALSVLAALGPVAALEDSDYSVLQHAHHKRAAPVATLLGEPVKGNNVDEIVDASLDKDSAYEEDVDGETDEDFDDLTTNATVHSHLESRASRPYLSRAHNAIGAMMSFYNNPRPGFWTEGWWNSANCYTLLADLRSRDNSAFIKQITDGPNGVFQHSITVQNRNQYGGLAWDDWYDDMQWWCVGLIKAYDVTGNKYYLDMARNTWKVVQNKALNAVCGGLYNAATNVPQRSQSAIATLLYVEVTASFAKRYPQDKQYFLNLATTQWNWVMNNIFQYNYIRGDEQHKNPQTGQCYNNGAILSYIEGTAINAAIALNAATGNYQYIQTANTIATRSLQDKGLNQGGILHDTCDANFGCNVDEAQFKGIFMRALRNLHDVQPSAANGAIPGFLKGNSNSIWNQARGQNYLLGMRWNGPYNNADVRVSLAQHSSATMALVAAALM